MKDVLNFVNEKTKILLVLREKQIEIDGKMVCPLNQQEIATLIECGKVKTNQLMKELAEEGYIQMAHSKGRYIILEKGYSMLEKMSLVE